MSLLHADADCFFASVELRRRPDLAGQPVAVATHIVMSATYPARARGVHGAMPLRQALKVCPDLVVLPPRADYRSAGQALMALFWRFAVQVEPGSMEEAFIDVGDTDPVAAATAIRRAARDELGLPVTVGVARTKLLAKLASRRAKPDGMLVITEAEEGRLRPRLTIDELWGVGPTTTARLADAGVTRVAELVGSMRLGCGRSSVPRWPAGCCRSGTRPTTRRSANSARGGPCRRRERRCARLLGGPTSRLTPTT